MKISYVFTCGRLESLFKILALIQKGEEHDASEDKKIIEQFRKDITLGRTFEETQLYQLIEESEEKIVMMLERRERIKRKDVEIELLISQPMAVKLLKSLLDKEVIIRKGQGKNVYYMLNKTTLFKDIQR